MNRAAPAEELGALYIERWAMETALDELKTHQRGPKVVLRSKTADGVLQEIYGHLRTHSAIRVLMSTMCHLGPRPTLQTAAAIEVLTPL